jgi:phosphoglycerate dehydrogenase-like enzyme/L-ascorbate metabolism protein UlaG (beta-lactamase superfamily)
MVKKTEGPSGRKVLVTPRALTKNPERVTELLAANRLVPVFATAGQQPSSAELTALLPGCIGWIAGVEQIASDVVAQAPDLRVLSRFGTGTSNVDLVATRRLGVEVRIAGGANAQSVAELALGLTLDCVRGITKTSSVVTSGGWRRQLGRELSGLIIAVVGYGAIGRIYATLMHSLGARPIVFDPMLPADHVLPEGISRADSLATALAQADVLSFHCPPGHQPVFNADLVSSCLPGLIVVNTARSELVDDNVMLAALQTGAVASYAVDAFDSEPPLMSDLLAHPDVIATPHLGAFTEEAIDRTLEVAVANVVAALAFPNNLEQVPFSGSMSEALGPEHSGGTLQCFWLGQAGFLLRAPSGQTILIDPYLSDTLATKYEGTIFPHTRMMDAPIEAAAFPRVDVVLVSHAHTDHMDPGTLGVIAAQHPHAIFVCPERVKDVALERGVPEGRLVGALGGDVLEPVAGIRIFPIPSAHEDLDVTDRGSAFLGYVIEVGDERIYHSGDCVPYPELSGLLAAHSITLALLPVNGRDQHRAENGAPGNFTLVEALAVCEGAGIPTMIAHHWGMFDFNTVIREELDEAWQEYSGPTSWYIPNPTAFMERHPALVLEKNSQEKQI